VDVDVGQAGEFPLEVGGVFFRAAKAGETAPSA